MAHSTHSRGLRGAGSANRSSQFEGRFGRMFRTLPAANHSEADLRKLADAMSAIPDVPAADQPDPEENKGIAAGYTYLGQFIDHDLTFDPVSSLTAQNDPDALTDFRTPRFDLDCLYGRGPNDQPYLYADDGLHLLQGAALSGNNDSGSKGIPRNTPNPGEPARGLLGDPRNDENVIISQIQANMIRFHNALVNKITLELGHSPVFEDVQQLVRWHYQWVVLYDFLPTIVGQAMVNKVLPGVGSGGKINGITPDLKFYKWKNMPFIPIEFTGAAYRFGHSMIRPVYRLSATVPIFQIFSNDPATSLVGFRDFPNHWAIDWSLFFPFEPRPDSGPTRLQPSYKIDTSLVNPLANLPKSIGNTVPSLPFRNLMRGQSFGLPSGQSVAKYMGLTPLSDDQIRIGKATQEDTIKNKSIIEISPAFKKNCPLWTYILAEAQQQFVNDLTPITLGPVGGRIIAEVFAGLLLGDKHSFANLDPLWTPTLLNTVTGKFTMADLLTFAKTA